MDNKRLKEQKSNTEEIRLNKFLSDAGFCSRRQADRLIEEGHVKVNNETALMGQKVTLLDKVTVDGKEVSREEEQIVIAFNKPVGVECTTDKNNPDNIDVYVYGREKELLPISRGPNKALILTGMSSAFVYNMVESQVSR